MPAPLVSVIIPVYNGARYLAEAIDSVLAQSYQPVELLLVDDGSTDDSAAIAQGYGDRLRYIHQDNQGVAVARNRGVEAARGNYLAFLDQDDFWTPDKLERQVPVLETESDVDYVLAQQHFFLESGEEPPAWLREEWMKKPQTGYLLGTLLVRRSTFDTVGAFDPAYELGSDVDWFARAKDAELGLRILDDVLLHKRVHGENESQRVEQSTTELLHILRRSIARHSA